MTDRGADSEELAEVLRHAGELLEILTEEIKSSAHAGVAHLLSGILGAQLDALRAVLQPND